MGYWLPRVRERFHFGRKVAAQVTQLTEQARSAHMLRSGEWPTALTVIDSV